MSAEREYYGTLELKSRAVKRGFGTGCMNE